MGSEELCIDALMQCIMERKWWEWGERDRWGKREKKRGKKKRKKNEEKKGCGGGVCYLHYTCKRRMVASVGEKSESWGREREGEREKGKKNEKMRKKKEMKKSKYMVRSREGEMGRRNGKKKWERKKLKEVGVVWEGSGSGSERGRRWGKRMLLLLLLFLLFRCTVHVDEEI